jgi:NAD(P)-dependent dehydrogenase (short-subunit alcohol dehydrogenase family)
MPPGRVLGLNLTIGAIMDYGLHGRTALVTGGDSVIGFRRVELLLREGAAVLLSDTAAERLEEATGRLRAHGTCITSPPT